MGEEFVLPIDASQEGMTLRYGPDGRTALRVHLSLWGFLGSVIALVLVAMYFALGASSVLAVALPTLIVALLVLGVEISWVLFAYTSVEVSPEALKFVGWRKSLSVPWTHLVSVERRTVYRWGGNVAFYFKWKVEEASGTRHQPVPVIWVEGILRYPACPRFRLDPSDAFYLRPGNQLSGVVLRG